MPDISLPLANAIYATSSVLQVIGALLAVLGIWGAIWSAQVRERFADERISGNEAETAKAVAEAAHANERAIELNVLLEQERAKRLEIEARLAPRHLTLQQRKSLIAALRETKLEEEITIAVIRDHETIEYAKEVVETLQEAGLRVRALPSDVLPTPIGIVIREPERADSVQDTLQTVFERAGIPINTGLTRGHPNARITIGTKAAP